MSILETKHLLNTVTGDLRLEIPVDGELFLCIPQGSSGVVKLTFDKSWSKLWK